ncbi:MAG TPA: 2-C-methyl-D-erythritol 4-phosphate cytidylyltransferase [Solirubrobacteraceae bacterium]|nr:2-C-methyl-D-erythritol 4-phosphate cytidylyltransferase [Solirubrobacteraceae bacterium]
MAVALILAAGRGERLGAGRPKALVELAGRPLLQWSVDVLASVPAIERIVVALPAGVEAPIGTVGVEGGAVRSASVRRALAAAGAGDPVLVHDAARPLLTAGLVRETLAVVEQEGVDAAVVAAPVTDTIKQSDAEHVVTQTLDRVGLWAVQTPQLFRRAALERALDVPDGILAQATDDAWLVERAGGRVVLVPTSTDNLKVTTPLDLALAELLIARLHNRDPRLSG